MPAFTHLKRYPQSIYQLRPQIRRFYVPHRFLSSPMPLISAASSHATDQQHDSVLSSLITLMSGIAAGSSLGFLYWFSIESNSDSGFPMDKSRCSLADWSTATTESTVDDLPPSRNLFHKLSLPDSSSVFLFGDAFRRKVFFNYEKRIRLRSPPEKVFEYFASFKTQDGELLMKPLDLMRAIVPVFPPSESNLVRDGYLRGERNPGEIRCTPSDFFMLFDMNNDGLVSFKEYIFFVTLLSIPESSFSVAFKMFDINNNGEITKEEFKKVMALMRTHNRQGAVHRDGLRFGLKINDSVENGGLVEYFFGKDGKGCLQHDKFVQFMRDLHDEMLRLEFAHYDYKNRGTISVKDFALSMVASADMSQLGSLLDRVDELNNKPYLKDIRITFEDFKHFAELRRKLQPFSLALFSYGELNGLLTREDFQRAAFHVCGVELTENVVDIIFHVFDSNRDGNLSANEFIKVLHKRERDIAQPMGTGLFGCCFGCADNFSLKSFIL